ncbi:response regulator [Rubrimonas cliftonensis]|uniref:Two component transcriptional regulator, winged helix family n=1 Tax=Rubrimonas cliftonensis TaxID=89524 RepID=A0A1H3YNJ0_9RHOB|nr:response regulator transcription factor [Rubrimonas cliftonensis]SEA13116.1 two component transcriptional regulator, winged helix family [Rubrimonas cliftonensis]
MTGAEAPGAPPARARLLDDGPAAPPAPPAHILVVDDDARIRALLAKFLARNGHLVTAARDAAHARRLLAGLAFDLMIVDVMMPGEDGVAFTRAIRPKLDTPILMLTARGETEARIEGLESGADDYLAKPFEPRELLLRVAAILRRVAPAPAPHEPPRTLALGALRYDVTRGQLWRGAEAVRLTASEAGLMTALAQTPGEPVSRAALSSALGGDAEAGERAVDVQITRLRRKLEADPRAPRYLQTVRGEGYMLVSD